MPYRRWLLTILCLSAALLTTQNAYAFRCDGGLITEGDSKISVLKKCGDPSWIDRWAEEIIEHPDTDFEHRIHRINERWIYNPGPTQFLRLITFKDGNVVAIETGSRGFTVSPVMQRCDFNGLSLGLTSAEIASKCGKPDVQDQRVETVTEKITGGRRQVTVTIDKWTFNLGPTRFMRILTFRNGNLIDISSGEKGFSE